MKNMCVKAEIPLGVAIESIKLAKCGICPLITPCETPVLEVDFLELTSLEGVPEAVDSTTVDVAVILVLCTPDLAAQPKPKHLLPTLWQHRAVH